MLHTQSPSYSTTSAERENIFEGKDVPIVEGNMIYFIFDGKDVPDASFAIDTLNVELK